MFDDIPDELLRDWMAGRIGYGALEADWWFLGMEESCEDAEAELPTRTVGGALEDLFEAHRRHFPRHQSLFKPPIKSQATWRPLIRIFLAANRRDHSLDDIKAYQATRWGRFGGETLLAELMPLPSPGKDAWPYSESRLPDLASRERYEAIWRPKRIALLRNLFTQNTPRVLIAYGRGDWSHYKKVVGGSVRWRNVPEGGALGAQYVLLPGPKPRLAVLTPHPVAKGLGNADWLALAGFIGRTLSGAGEAERPRLSVPVRRAAPPTGAGTLRRAGADNDRKAFLDDARRILESTLGILMRPNGGNAEANNRMGTFVPGVNVGVVATPRELRVHAHSKDRSARETFAEILAELESGKLPRPLPGIEILLRPGPRNPDLIYLEHNWTPRDLSTVDLAVVEAMADWLASVRRLFQARRPTLGVIP
jgi:hypothetical protein